MTTDELMPLVAGGMVSLGLVLLVLVAWRKAREIRRDTAHRLAELDEHHRLQRRADELLESAKREARREDGRVAR